MQDFEPRDLADRDRLGDPPDEAGPDAALAPGREAHLRNDGKWCTPSGAFLELLRQFASEEKIAEIANACEIYFDAYRGARPYVASSLPAIILNSYKPLTAGVDFSKFLRWADENPDWADRIKSNAGSTRLVSVVDEMRASLQRF